MLAYIPYMDPMGERDIYILYNAEFFFAAKICWIGISTYRKGCSQVLKKKLPRSDLKNLAALRSQFGTVTTSRRFI
jgi:hypothetical protein